METIQGLGIAFSRVRVEGFKASRLVLLRLYP